MSTSGAGELSTPWHSQGEQGYCPTLQHRLNKAMLVTHTISHEQGLQIPMPAQGNIALREKQGRKEQPCCSLGGCEGLTLPGSSRAAQPYGCMPTIQYVTPIQDQGPSRSAAWQLQRDAQASGYHSLKGYTPEAFSISRDPWVFLLCQLMSDTTACGFWKFHQLLQLCCGLCAGVVAKVLG